MVDEGIIARRLRIEADQASLKTLGDKTSNALISGFRKAQKEQMKLIEAAYRAPISPRVFSEYAKKAKKLAAELQELQWKGYGEALTKAEAKALKAREKALLRQFKTESDRVEKLSRRRMEAARAVEDFKKKELDEQIEAYGAGLAGAITGALGSVRSGDLKGVGDIVKGAGGAMRTRGRAAQAAGAADTATKMQKAMGSLGGVMAGLGAAVATIGAVVGAIGLLVKVLLDAEAAVKDVNKSIIQMGGATNLGATGVADLAAKLRPINEFFSERPFSVEWYTTPEMLEGIAKGFSEAGFTMRKMSDEIKVGTQHMDGLRGATVLALTYANLFGKEASAVAQDMGKIAFEQGSTLNRIAEGFSAVHEMARVSGFEVKRFYSAVLESTTGMGMYNRRIEEAAALLSTLSNILGETVGGEFLKSIQAGFKDMSLEERLKQILVQGKGNVSEMYESAMRTALEGVRGDFADMVTPLGQAFDITSLDDLADKLGKMDPLKFNKALADALRLGLTGEQANRIRQLRGLARGETGDVGTQAIEMGKLGPVYKIVGAIEAAQQITGKKSIADFSVEEFMAAAKVGGVTEQQMIDEVRALAGNAEGTWSILKDIASGKRKATPEELDYYKTQYGAVIENGKVINEASKKEMDEFTDLLMSSQEMQELMAKNEEQVSEDIELAREIAHNTESVTNVLKTTVQDWLKQIYWKATEIYEYLPNLVPEYIKKLMEDSPMGMTEAQAKSEAMKTLSSEIDALSGAEERVREKLASEELGAEERKALQGFLKSLSEQKQARELAHKDIRFARQGSLGGDPNAILRSRLEGYKGGALETIDPRTLTTAPGTDQQGMVSWKGAESILLQRMTKAFGEAGMEGEEGKKRKWAARRMAQQAAASTGQIKLNEYGVPVGGGKEYDPEAGMEKALAKALNTELLAYFEQEKVAFSLTDDGLRKQEEAVLKAVTDPRSKEAQVAALKDERVQQANLHTLRVIEQEKELRGMDLGALETLAKEKGLYEQAFGGEPHDGMDDETRRALLVGTLAENLGKAVNDFILTKDGQLLQTNPLDTVVGFKGGGMGARNTTINIHGGDTQKIYSVVRRAMEGAR